MALPGRVLVRRRLRRRPGIPRTPAGEITPDQMNNLGVQTRSEGLVLAVKNNLIQILLHDKQNTCPFGQVFCLKETGVKCQ